MSSLPVERAWQQYAKSLPTNEKHCTDARKDISDFVGVNLHTIRRWITLNSVRGVRGMPAIKLRVFLELQGYTLSEFSGMKSSIKTFAEILAYDVVSMEDACREIDGESNQKTIDRNYSLFFGRSKESVPERMQAIESFNQTHLENLAQKKSEWRTRIGKVTVESEPASSAHIKNGAVEKSSESEERNVLKQMFASLVPALLKVTEYFSSDACSPEERRALRALVGEQVIFRLSTATARLCNETSRAQYSSTKETSR